MNYQEIHGNRQNKLSDVPSVKSLPSKNWMSNEVGEIQKWYNPIQCNNGIKEYSVIIMPNIVDTFWDANPNHAPFEISSIYHLYEKGEPNWPCLSHLISTKSWISWLNWGSTSIQVKTNLQAGLSQPDFLSWECDIGTQRSSLEQYWM